MGRAIRIEYPGAVYHLIAPWVSERLWMGEESRVSRAVRLVETGRDDELASLKQRLLAQVGGGPKEPAPQA